METRIDQIEIYLREIDHLTIYTDHEDVGQHRYTERFIIEPLLCLYIRLPAQEAFQKIVDQIGVLICGHMALYQFEGAGFTRMFAPPLQNIAAMEPCITGEDVYGAVRVARYNVNRPVLAARDLIYEIGDSLAPFASR